MKKLLFSLNILLLLTACNQQPQKNGFENVPVTFHHTLDLQGILTTDTLEGSMIIFEPQKNEYWTFNDSGNKIARTPASTFKIFNSLVGLETGVIKDENFVIRWDGVKRSNPKWNEDHDLKTAYKNSTVWYYQELARRVGGEKMVHWLDTAGYGNRDTSGGIDKFWLAGGLKISPEEQVKFLQLLQENKLPFSQRSVDMVKKIMIAEDSNGYVLRAKTGWGFEDNADIGWYVGYVTKGGKVYYFAACLQNRKENDENFARQRIDFAREGLKQAGAIN